VTEGPADVAGPAAEGAGPARRAGAAGAGGLVAASLCPLSTTASVIAAPAAASAPPVTAAPDRKLISSIRAYTELLSLPIMVTRFPSDIARYMGIKGNAGFVR